MTEQTWTVVKFCEENSVEAVPTTWLVGSDHCYWPPFPQNKVLQAIRRQVFRCGTYDKYLEARGKARKAENESDLNSDCDKWKRAGRHKKVISSEEISDESSSERESPKDRPKNNLSLNPPRMSDFSSHQSISIDNEVNCPKEPSRNVSVLSNTSKTDMNNQAIGVPTCSCCPQHKYNETLKSVQKQYILVRNILTQVLEETQKLKDIKSSEKDKEDEMTSIFSRFHYLPINNEEQLNEIEEYLQDEKHFTATINELYKLGGSTVHDLVKRCLNSMISNAYAAEFSWQGMKKKRVFSNLKLAKVLIGACEKSTLAENTKISEEAIKKWLRRAKERSDNQKKKTC